MSARSSISRARTSGNAGATASSSGCSISRVDGTRLIAETAARLPGKPVLVCASAIGFYGNRGDDEVDESSARGDGSSRMSSTSGKPRPTPRAQPASAPSICGKGSSSRRQGGALQRLLLPFKLGAGGRVGSGKQWWSWVSLDDTVAAYLFALEHPLEGAVNVTAPGATTNLEFTKALGRALHRPTILPLPGFAVKAAFGQMGAGDAPRGAASHTDEDRRGRLHVQPPRHRLRARERTRRLIEPDRDRGRLAGV